MSDHATSPDALNAIGVLKRREIEARILAPLIEDLSAEFGRERVLEIVRRAIIRIAREQGAQLVEEKTADRPKPSHTPAPTTEPDAPRARPRRG